jgi:DNA-binding NtrC family response regulator
MARILLVDDNKDLLLLISAYLVTYGFEVELARDAAQAQNHLERSRFDVIVSDFNMPGESGLDLLDYVVRRHPRLPFIMMSGLCMSWLRDEAIKRGCSGYIEKPFELKELVGAIETAASLSNRVTSGLAMTG